jgi:hypothetical protein
MIRLVALLAAITLAIVGCGEGDTPQVDPVTPEPTILEVAKSDCAHGQAGTYVVIGDDGSTLTIDTKGEDSPGVDVATVACILIAIDTPDAVISQLDATRAMDGRQDATWGDFSASWTYHPDDGLDLILQETS